MEHFALEFLNVFYEDEQQLTVDNEVQLRLLRAPSRHESCKCKVFTHQLAFSSAKCPKFTYMESCQYTRMSCFARRRLCPSFY
eukprot:6189089-Pleurochrysis_carterae.AAC.1